MAKRKAHKKVKRYKKSCSVRGMLRIIKKKGFKKSYTLPDGTIYIPHKKKSRYSFLVKGSTIRVYSGRKLFKTIRP